MKEFNKNDIEALDFMVETVINNGIINGGYFGSDCATDFGGFVPTVSV